MITVINATVAVTLLEQRPEKIQALSGIQTHDLCVAGVVHGVAGAVTVQCTGNAEVVGSNPAQSLNFFRSLF